MATFNLPFGIRISNSNVLDASRYVVPDIPSRDFIITDGRAYNGMQTYVESDETLYILKDVGMSDWQPVMTDTVALIDYVDGSLAALNASVNLALDSYTTNATLRGYLKNTSDNFYGILAIQRGVDISIFTATRKWSRTDTSIFEDGAKVAISDDGKYITAVQANGFATGYIHSSSDYGQTWVLSNPNTWWGGIAVSATGQYQTAGIGNMTIGAAGFVYCSSNYGVTWTQKGSSQVNGDIAMSDSGQYQLTAGADFNTIGVGPMRLSSNYGNTWGIVETTRGWTAVAMSGSGQYMAAATYGDSIYISSDYGQNWTPKGPSLPFATLSMSKDGKYLTAGGSNNDSYVYASDDYGNTWNTTSFFGKTSGIKVLYNGAVQLMASDASLYTSIDYGTTWVSNSSLGTASYRVRHFTASEDAKYLAAISYYGIQISASTSMFTSSHIDLVNQSIINVAYPVNSSDAVNKQYVDDATYIINASITRIDACLNNSSSIQSYVNTSTYYDGSLNDIRGKYIKSASTGAGLYWNAGLLDVSVAGGTTTNAWNGLTKTNSSIGLGGTILSNTTIDTSIYDLLIGNPEISSPRVKFNGGSKELELAGGIVAGGKSQITLATSSLQIQALNLVSGSAATILMTYDGSMGFGAGGAANVNLSATGFRYAADYSSSWSDRHLIDKGFGDLKYVRNASLSTSKFAWVGGYLEPSVASGTGASNLSELNDVSISIDVSDGSFLKYEASTGKWKNITSVEASLYFWPLSTALVKEVSLNTSKFSWVGGYLEPSIAGGGISQAYVDGSISALNASVNLAFNSKINGTTDILAKFDASENLVNSNLLNTTSGFNVTEPVTNKTTMSFQGGSGTLQLRQILGNTASFRIQAEASDGSATKTLWLTGSGGMVVGSEIYFNPGNPTGYGGPLRMQNLVTYMKFYAADASLWIGPNRTTDGNGDSLLLTGGIPSDTGATPRNGGKLTIAAAKAINGGVDGSIYLHYIKEASTSYVLYYNKDVSTITYGLAPVGGGGTTTNAWNGLTKTDSSIGLGGTTLIEPVTIDAGAFSLSLTATRVQHYIGTQSYALEVNTVAGSNSTVSKIDANGTQVAAVINSSQGISTGVTSNIGEISFAAWPTILRVASLDASGFKYSNDLSSTWSDRSLVDKGYVRTQTGVKTFQTLTINVSTAQWDVSAGYNAKVTLTTNTSLNISCVNGDSGTLIVTQDGTGNRLLQLPTPSLKNDGWSLSTAINAVDIISFVYDGTSYYWNKGGAYA